MLNTGYRMLILLFVALLAAGQSSAVAGNDSATPVIWVEGEKPVINKMNRHPWWYDKVKHDQLSGGDLISNFSKDKAGEAEYHFSAGKAGEYDFWVRANPIQSRLSCALNGGPDTPIDLNREKRGRNQHRGGWQARPAVHRVEPGGKGDAARGGELDPLSA